MKIIQDHMASKEEYEQREKSLPISSVRFIFFIFVCLYICILMLYVTFVVLCVQRSMLMVTLLEISFYSNSMIIQKYFFFFNNYLFIICLANRW